MSQVTRNLREKISACLLWIIPAYSISSLLCQSTTHLSCAVGVCAPAAWHLFSLHLNRNKGEKVHVLRRELNMVFPAKAEKTAARPQLCTQELDFCQKAVFTLTINSSTSPTVHIDFLRPTKIAILVFAGKQSRRKATTNDDKRRRLDSQWRTTPDNPDGARLVAQLAAEQLSPVGGTAGKAMGSWSRSHGCLALQDAARC